MNTYRHVWFATGIDSLCYWVYEVARYAKITDFDLTPTVNENIGRLDVPVDDLELRVQVMEGI